MVSEQEIRYAAEIIKQGGLVAFPTETVYGLGANALNPLAVARIFTSKERPSFDPLIVHIASIADLEILAEKLDDRVYILADKFWPGPLTIVLPKSKIVPDIVTSGLNTVGIRMPDNRIALELIKHAGCPIAAPSANKFGRISPTKAQHVKKQLPDIDCILDGGSTTIGIESTVITLHSDGFVILRQGKITKEDLEKVLPYSKQDIDQNEIMSSPGNIKSHYSPNKPLYILGDNLEGLDTKNAAFLSFGTIPDREFKIIEFLSENGNLDEAAIKLFEKLHILEDSDVEFIIAEPVPEKGIGIAIMDRLQKAAHKYL
ncbi:MAG: threonylcarbamoyl-AMP synthase [Saprospiraceae bacterium]|nr:threonylcarbamoyl-AMP synthase [Saprospiraceae bacterium]